MKRMLFMALAAVGMCVFAQEISLSDARAKIDKVIANPAEMTSTMKQLSSSDQVAFLAAVNEAIGKMPGSKVEQAVTYLNVNKAAMRGAQKGNLSALVAECFATIPVEVLPIISEDFAANLFNRDANSSVSYTDANFIKIAQTTMETVNARTEKVDNSGVRSTFAALMFIRASNTMTDEIVDGIAQSIPEKYRDKAVKEWIPEALGQGGKSASYDTVFAASDVVDTLEVERVLSVAGPQFMESMLTDLTGMNTDASAYIFEHTPVIDTIYNKFQTPVLAGGMNNPVGGNGGGSGGVVPPVPPLPPQPQPQPIEPVPYPHQLCHE